MFNAIAAHREMSAKIADLDPGLLDALACPSDLEYRASYLNKLLGLVGDLAEQMAKDADGSQNTGKIDFEDIRAIHDIASDVCGQIKRCADREVV